MIKTSDCTSLGNLYASYDGNILAWSLTDGSVKQGQDYDPFGNVVLKQTLAGGPLAGSQGELNYGFSTKPQDTETKLLYYGYRYYDPVNGRWPSRDPIEENGGINIYGFVINDPINIFGIKGLKGYSMLVQAGYAASEEAARKSFDYDRSANPGNTSTFRWRLEYAGLICYKCDNPENERFRYTPPHPGLPNGPGRDGNGNLQKFNYSPAGGKMDMSGAMANPFVDHFDSYGGQPISCESVFGKGWVMVGRYHSHPPDQGIQPSVADYGLTLPGRNSFVLLNVQFDGKLTLPAFAVAPQRSAILKRFPFPSPAMRADQFSIQFLSRSAS